MYAATPCAVNGAVKTDILTNSDRIHHRVAAILGRNGIKAAVAVAVPCGTIVGMHLEMSNLCAVEAAHEFCVARSCRAVLLRCGIPVLKSLYHDAQ